MTLLLSNDDVDRLLTMRECIDALDLAYRELAAGRGTDRRRSDSFVGGPVEGSLYSLKSMDGIAPAFGVGRGYQFAAVGGAPYRKAKAAGASRELPTEWFTQDVHP